MSLLGINTYTSNFTLNSSLIESLKEAETTSINSSLSKSLSSIQSDSTIISSFVSQLENLLTKTETDTSGYSATTSGDNMIFNSEDEDLLKEGFLTFDVSSVARRDVYQSNVFTSSDDLFGNTILDINGNSIDTTGKTVSQVQDEINNLDAVRASLEEVGTNQFRIVLKSEEAGTANAISISSSDFSQVQTASNLEVNVDGIDYEYNSNRFESNGLTIDVTGTGTSTINIRKDVSEVQSKFSNIVTSYNDLVSYTNDTILFNNTFSSDKGVFKDIMNTMKESLFENDLFTNGVELDKSGLISITGTPSTFILETFINDLKSKLEEITSENGILNDYEETQDKLSTKYEKEISNNLEYLDKKYETLSAQFTEYNSVISLFESNFASLKQMIEYQSSN